MANIEASPKKPLLKTDQAPLGILTGYIELKGPQTEGSLAISFSTSMVLAISNNLLGETLTELDESSGDVVGELTNMVCGGAKNILADQGYDFEMASPIILEGEDQPVKHLSATSPVILLPFEAPEGEFFIEVCFLEN